MQLRRYIDRIAYRGDVRPTLAALNELQLRHVCSVPFENLDVQFTTRVTTDVEAAFEKIVVNGRGGWCYEQNGLFGWALSEFGFDVTRVAASVMREESPVTSSANHLCLLVRVPGEPDTCYLADVGFGGSMLQPIELAESVHEHVPFHIGLRTLDDGHWQFWEDKGLDEFCYDFRAEAADETALAERCWFLQSEADSAFVLNLVAQLRAPRMQKNLRGRVLTTVTSSGSRETVLNSADDLVETLEREFGLTVPEVAGLWPRVLARHEELFATSAQE